MLSIKTTPLKLTSEDLDNLATDALHDCEVYEGFVDAVNKEDKAGKNRMARAYKLGFFLGFQHGGDWMKFKLSPEPPTLTEEVEPEEPAPDMKKLWARLFEQLVIGFFFMYGGITLIMKLLGIGD